MENKPCRFGKDFNYNSLTEYLCKKHILILNFINNLSFFSTLVYLKPNRLHVVQTWQPFLLMSDRKLKTPLSAPRMLQ